jgi:hypothetical protein
MSFLWTTAMAWEQLPGDPERTPVSVRHAGFAGYVGPADDKDLREFTAPSITPSVHFHIKQYGRPPQDYIDEHRERYQKAKANLTDEDIPDIQDPRLHHFMRTSHKKPVEWRGASLDLTKQPIYATQSHVAREHIQRYTDDPSSGMHNPDQGSEDPVIVTHEGRIHVGDGHHRVAAALARGETHLPVWHFDLDGHYMPDYDDKDHS